ncbi:MAG: hypothetical protein CMK59_13345 [Proteobacteria bacterium]|nr:hypothetical protein [Pseudomonadota bacterium]
MFFLLLSNLSWASEQNDNSAVSFGYFINSRPTVAHNPDFNFDTKDSTWAYNQNIRLISTGTWDGFVVRASFQEARTWGSSPTPPFSADAIAGMHEGYLQVGTPDNSSLWLRVGRQAFNFGAGNILGGARWNFYGIAHDGFRIHNEYNQFSWDLLGIQQSGSSIFETSCQDDIETPDVDECETFSPETVRSAGDQLWIFTAKATVNKSLTVQPYVLFLSQNETVDDPDRNRQIYSPGLLLTGKLSSSIKYLVEGTYQTGQVNDDVDHSAWKAVLDLNWSSGPTGLRFHYENNSGDGNSNDSVNNDFVPFYPNNHAYRGLSDKVGGINSQDLLLEFRYAINDTFQVKTQAHHFALSNPDGHWYRNNGTSMGSASNNDSSTIGEEIDLVLEWSPRKGETFRLVHAHLFPRGAGEEIAGSDSSSATYIWFLVSK